MVVVLDYHQERPVKDDWRTGVGAYRSIPFRFRYYPCPCFGNSQTYSLFNSGDYTAVKTGQSTVVDVETGFFTYSDMSLSCCIEKMGIPIVHL